MNLAQEACFTPSGLLAKAIYMHIYVFKEKTSQHISNNVNSRGFHGDINI